MWKNFFKKLIHCAQISIRTNFNEAIDNAKRSGSGSDDIPKPKTWYYEEMLFIKDQLNIAPTESSQSEDQVVLEEDRENQLPTGSQQTPVKKKRRSQDPTDELVGLASAYFKKPETEADILAKAWAIKLNKLSQPQRTFAEKIINDTLFEAEMGNLTRYGVHFKSGSSSFHSQNSPYLSTTPSPYMSPPRVNRVHCILPDNQHEMRAAEYVLEVPESEHEMTAAEYLSNFSSF